MSNRNVGRELRALVQIEQDECQLDYGVLPCRASIGGTGEAKCFKTMATCQDPEHYDVGKKSLWFCKPEERLPDFPVIPMVVSVSTSPTVLNPGGGSKSSGPLGKRASVVVTFQDAPHSDIGTDPYVDERTYRPIDRGTFWAKWLARNLYYNNRVLRVYEGYADQAPEQMISRTYLIDKIDGPDSAGRVRVTAKDVLKLADNDKAQAPRASTGELVFEYPEEGTDDILITGAPASDYPAPGRVRINDEIIRYAGVSIVDDHQIRLTGIVRGSDGTQAASHDEGDRVQWCLRFANQRCDVIARSLLTNYGDIPAEFIDVSKWNAEGSLWLAQFTLTGLITEPTGVNDLLSELTEQCLFYIWWDERQQKIEMEAIKPPDDEEAVPRLSDDKNIIADSAAMAVDPAGRVSQVWVYWGQSDPTKKLDEEGNYRRIRVRVDALAESDNQYGEQRIKKIFSRWLNSEGQAINTSSRLLMRYRNNPRTMTIAVDAKDRDHWTGDVLDVSHRNIVDATGMPVWQRFQIISAEETVPGHRAEYQMQVYEFGVGFRFGRWMLADAPNYDDATLSERNLGAWWANSSGEVDGDPGYVWV